MIALVREYFEILFDVSLVVKNDGSTVKFSLVDTYPVSSKMFSASSARLDIAIPLLVKCNRILV